MEQVFRESYSYARRIGVFVLNVKLANRVDIIDLIFLEKDNEMLTAVFCLDFMVLVSVN